MPNSKGLNIVFAGTPDFAATHLKSLIESHHSIVSVYTQPDRPAGRGKKLSPSPVKSLALEHDLKVEQPPSLRDETAQTQLANYQADVMVVVAYGLLLPKAVLDTPKFGCLNVHGSVLPRWRGAAPIQRAIEAGDSHSGITIMQMDEGLDTGDMLHIVECPIMPDDTASELHDRLASLGPEALLKTLDDIQNGALKPQKQDDSQATYAHKLSKAEAHIRWEESAALIARKIRAFNPFPVAYTELDGERIRIFSAKAQEKAHGVLPGTVLSNNGEWTIACGENSILSVNRLQLPGKKQMAVRDAINGFADKLAPGKVLN